MIIHPPSPHLSPSLPIPTPSNRRFHNRANSRRRNTASTPSNDLSDYNQGQETSASTPQLIEHAWNMQGHRPPASPFLHDELHFPPNVARDTFGFHSYSSEAPWLYEWLPNEEPPPHTRSMYWIIPLPDEDESFYTPVQGESNSLPAAMEQLDLLPGMSTNLEPVDPAPSDDPIVPAGPSPSTTPSLPLRSRSILEHPPSRNKEQHGEAVSITEHSSLDDDVILHSSVTKGLPVSVSEPQEKGLPDIPFVQDSKYNESPWGPVSWGASGAGRGWIHDAERRRTVAWPSGVVHRHAERGDDRT
ncbi:hypothetical protein H0H81_007324 [Sphagnurus paluster]|uniref:Uncharacterized protein n=1 Tax=Sphagnurus paluster TaxID=117069 RepID=A0A9P7FXL4_9AGAR|nr:hypothetical protein H0H81_007324 [Sphagnurus paluster]